MPKKRSVTGPRYTVARHHPGSRTESPEPTMEAVKKRVAAMMQDAEKDAAFHGKAPTITITITKNR